MDYCSLMKTEKHEKDRRNTDSWKFSIANRWEIRIKKFVRSVICVEYEDWKRTGIIQILESSLLLIGEK
jgi:hypothetical protein